MLEPGARTGKSTDDIRAGIGIGEPGDPMFTLQSGKQHGVAVELSNGDVSHCLNAGGMGRIDYETETLVTHAQAFKASHFTRGKDGAPSDIAPPVSADADKGDQDTLVLASSTGDGYWREGDTTGTLRGRSQESHEHLVAFSCKDSGGDASDVSPTLRAMEFDKSRFSEEDVARPVKPQSDHQMMVSPWAVRRLLPVECARLQGFSDTYLDITYRGKPAADGPKYRALGNSFATPVVRWIGTRINALLKAEL